jgi:hypothetical protein
VLFISKTVAHFNIFAISNWHLFLLATLVISPFNAYRNRAFSSCSGVVVVVAVAAVVVVVVGLLIVV